MHDLWYVLLLGVIEGITEFLPISSTGHLLVAEQLGLGQRSEVFNVVVQAGAILAVCLVYRQRLVELATGLRKPHVQVEVGKLIVAFGISGLFGLMAKELGAELPTDVAPVAWALVLGAVWMVVAEAIAARRPSYDRVTWTGAVAVGVAQVVAGVFPGTSRSAATIFAAMLVGGATRGAATEFAFLVGIPTMFAASALELHEALEGSQAEDWTAIAVGFVVSAVVAFAAVKWLLVYIREHRFTAFAVYRLVLGGLLLLLA